MRSSVKSWIAVSGLAVVLGLGAGLSTASAQPERPGQQPRQPLRPGDQPRQPRQPGQPAQPGQPGQGPRGGGEGGMGMQGAMRQLDRSMTMLEEAMGEPDRRDESLMAAAAVQRATAQARMAAGRDIKPDLQDAFRRHHIEMTRAALDLEVALLDGNVGKAQAAFEKIEKMRDQAADKFGLDEMEEGEEAPAAPRPRGRDGDR